MRVQGLGHWVSSFLAIVLTGKARNVVLVITNCIFGAMIDYGKFEKCKPVPYCYCNNINS